MGTDANVKAWQAKHPDKMRKYRKKWSKNNREKELQSKRDYWNRKKYGMKTRPSWASRIVGNIGKALGG